jgi:hypothetical protein
MMLVDCEDGSIPLEVLVLQVMVFEDVKKQGK